MKYQFEGAVQLYCPESIEEARLVEDRLYDIMLLRTARWSIWPWKKTEVAQPWFTATTLLPYTSAGTEVGMHVENALERPSPPMVVTVSLALPVSYHGSALVARWEGDSSDDGFDFERLIRDRLQSDYKFNGVKIIETIEALCRKHNRLNEV